MADYFFVLDGAWFEEQARPALAACRQLGSFAPCRSLCATLRPAADTFVHRYRTSELLLTQVEGLAYDRDLWRLLVGEVLLVAAAAPELQTCPDTLCCLLAPELNRGGGWRGLARQQLPEVLQAHRGSRDLTFGRAVYHPERCGHNNREDVCRLAAYLETVRPEEWTVEGLAELHGVEADDRAEELAFARDWFGPLRDLYCQARERGQVIVTEQIS
jgi:hypothetical protein